jgi:hypothetical protein
MMDPPQNCPLNSSAADAVMSATCHGASEIAASTPLTMLGVTSPADFEVADNGEAPGTSVSPGAGVSVGVGVGSAVGPEVDVGEGAVGGVGVDVCTGAGDVEDDGSAGLAVDDEPAVAKTGPETPNCTRVEIAIAIPTSAPPRLNRPDQFMKNPGV